MLEIIFIANVEEIFNKLAFYYRGKLQWTTRPRFKSQYDDNGDGQIDRHDAVWNKLRIWQDADNDGITDSGELKTLVETGLSAISTTGKVVTKTDASGNKISHRGEATMEKSYLAYACL